ncbi:MAG TPA: 16S rRNA (adenine(1518)-N(6)/adenine(1519)-N(6))-dimethyltransferase RsmA [Burkholderiales bacterium]|nr:16S rRNA (adenine(1518)-N(6)/adenine(1519)-N(6))-dimethyltransferase RsmA [Burkholderiales bacterium]
MSRHRARKRFGQHFLRDPGVVGRIVDAIAPRANDITVEIGPGEGVLTRKLAEQVTPLHAVEFDRDLVSRLRAEFPPQRVIVHEADALDFDFRKLASSAQRLRVVGNLPYNISTPLLFHLLEQVDCIADMVFMLQKEVVDRLAAPPDTSDYGRLSVMIQWRLKVERLFDVGPEAFDPPPKVDSAVVRLTPHAAAPIVVRDPHVFAGVVRAAFAHRRKMLRNNLKDVIPNEQLAALGIDPQRRAETLTLAEFARIADSLVSRC